MKIINRSGEFPFQKNTITAELLLELSDEFRQTMNGNGGELFRETEPSQKPGSLADIPLHRMQTITTIGDVRRAQVFARGQKVGHPLRDQCTHWYLKRQRRDIEVISARAGWV